MLPRLEPLRIGEAATRPSGLFGLFFGETAPDIAGDFGIASSPMTAAPLPLPLIAEEVRCSVSLLRAVPPPTTKSIRSLRNNRLSRMPGCAKVPNADVSTARIGMCRIACFTSRTEKDWPRALKLRSHEHEKKEKNKQSENAYWILGVDIKATLSITFSPDVLLLVGVI